MDDESGKLRGSILEAIDLLFIEKMM